MLTNSSSSSPATSLPRSASSNFSVDIFMVDTKNAPRFVFLFFFSFLCCAFINTCIGKTSDELLIFRYDGMIFEALSALADANGSNVGSIFSFIEVLANSWRLFKDNQKQIPVCYDVHAPSAIIMLYDGMIFEALSALADANGSDVGSIFSFIELGSVSAILFNSSYHYKKTRYIPMDAIFVCYISYPRITDKDDPWIVVMSINPRGRVDGSSDSDPLQPNSTSNVSPVEDLEDVELVVDFTQFGDDAVVHSESEAEGGEFDEDSEDSTDSE
ncbi:hypothetical protein F2Q69_00020616 [Brassica cretica]|uniref:Uncharacterized protein n=2 Tax=Brassica cretica TaxID=69181 RepID=A0A8S9QDK8_BRACR|nr:hypothetical protein F2Q69_00020616 [Brassica cretica]